VHYVASFSGLSVFDFPFGILYRYLEQRADPILNQQQYKQTDETTKEKKTTHAGYCILEQRNDRVQNQQQYT